ncbi:MAG: site-specific integrase, partial [Rikenellaceae bacterium]
MRQIKLQFKPSSVDKATGEIVIEVLFPTAEGQFETGVYIQSDEWDLEGEKIIFDSDNILRAIFLYNNWERLNGEVEKLKIIIQKLEHRRPNFTFEELEVKFRGANGKKEFLAFIDEQVLLLMRDKRVKTAQSYNSTRNIFAQFLGNKDIAMEYVDSDLMCDFEQFLLNKKMVRNSTSFYLRILRSIYNKAVQQDLVKQNSPFSQVYTGIDKTQKRAATQRAIYDLENDKRLSRNMALARDLFLFSFYCRGISFVDMARLKQENIKNGILSYVRSKTGQ